MRYVYPALAGVATSVIFVLGVGLLTVQKIGLGGGAVLGLNNELIAVTEPRPGLMQMSAIAAVSALVLFILIAGSASRARQLRFAFRTGFAATSVALIGTSVIMMATVYTANDVQQGFAPGWNGWLEEGGSSSAVHVVVLVVLGALWLQRGVNRSEMEQESNIREQLAAEV